MLYVVHKVPSHRELYRYQGFSVVSEDLEVNDIPVLKIDSLNHIFTASTILSYHFLSCAHALSQNELANKSSCNNEFLMLS